MGSFNLIFACVILSAAVVADQWIVGENEASCTTACSAVGATCDKNAFRTKWADVDTEDEVSELMAVKGDLVCASNKGTYSSWGPAIWRSDDFAWCYKGHSKSYFSCDATSASTQRLCWCTGGSDPTPAPSATPTDTPTAVAWTPTLNPTAMPTEEGGMCTTSPLSYSATCPTPAAFSGSITYPGTSSDMYLNYCLYMVNSDCLGMCTGSLSNACADECANPPSPPTPACTVHCSIDSTGILEVTHDTTSGHTSHKCFKDGPGCTCTCL